VSLTQRDLSNVVAIPEVAIVRRVIEDVVSISSANGVLLIIIGNSIPS
jgi:hypothetical protein